MLKTFNSLLFLLICCTIASAQELTTLAAEEVAQASLGKILWTYEALNNVRPTIFLTKKLVVGAIYGGDEIVALKRNSGKLAWVASPPKNFKWVKGMFALSPNEDIMALILQDGDIWASELVKGRTTWTYKPSGGSRSLFTHQHLYSLTAIGSIHALQWKSGQIKWRYRPLPDDIVITAVTPHKKRLYLASRGGRARAIGYRRGLQQWQSDKIEELAATSPIVSSTRILLQTKDDKIIALHHYTGETAWQYSYETPLAIAPSLSEERVTICRKNGVVTSVGLGLGKRLWERDFNTPLGHIEVSNRYVLLHAPLKEELIVLSARKGNTLWRKKVRLNEGQLFCKINKSLIICGSSADITWQREIVAYHGRTGQSVWRLRLPQSLSSMITIDKGRKLYCAVGDTILAATFNPPPWATVLEVDH